VSPRKSPSGGREVSRGTGQCKGAEVERQERNWSVAASERRSVRAGSVRERKFKSPVVWGNESELKNVTVRWFSPNRDTVTTLANIGEIEGC